MKTQMDFYQLLIMVIHILRRMIVGSDHEEIILLGDIIFCVKHSFLCVCIVILLAQIPVFQIYQSMMLPLTFLSVVNNNLRWLKSLCLFCTLIKWKKGEGG